MIRFEQVGKWFRDHQVLADIDAEVAQRRGGGRVAALQAPASRR